MHDFKFKLDDALDLIAEDEFIVVEANSEDPQSTNKPSLGPKKGPRKGSPSKKHDPEEESD